MQVALFLKDSWITTLRASIRTCLRDVGKGWFNIHETNWEVYQISKLKKFMETVKFIMQVRKEPDAILFDAYFTYLLNCLKMKSGGMLSLWMCWLCL